MMSRIFLLSPAHCGGRRARMVISDRAAFPLAARLRGREGAPLGDVFAFLSGLYFRGKLAYARAFARPPDPGAPLGGTGVLVITPSAGLRPADTPITVDAIRQFARVSVAPDERRYRAPLERSARLLQAELGAECEVVLLGSIASAKYVDVLGGIFGDRLTFPVEFVGRGDMSRGGLMLRAAASGQELTYVPVAGAIRHGPRPAKLDPATRAPRGFQ